MGLITRVNIKDRALTLTDYQNSSFPQDSELNGWVNEGIQEFYDIMTSVLQDYFVEDPHEVTIASGQSEINLTTELPNFYRLKGIDYKFDSTRYYDLQSFDFKNRNHYNYSVGEVLNSYRRIRVYRILGSKIKLLPADNADGIYRVWYIPLAALLTNDTDTFDDFNGWAEYVVNYVARNLKIKADESTQQFDATMGKLAKRIQSMASNRDLSKIDVVNDSSRHSNFGDYGGYDGY